MEKNLQAASTQHNHKGGNTMNAQKIEEIINGFGKRMDAALTVFEAKITALESQVKALEEKPVAAAVRDRGPTSTRDMTLEDATRIMLGDLKSTNHRQAAEILGLSYGQVYSARGGYTFKGVYKQMVDAKAAAAKAPVVVESTPAAEKLADPPAEVNVDIKAA